MGVLVFDGEVYSQQFSVKRTIASLSWSQLPGEKEIGCQSPSMCCWRTAPTAVSEASVMRQVGASGLG